MMERMTIKAPSGLIRLADNKEHTMNLAIKKLSDYEDLEEQKTNPCNMCLNGRIDEDLTDDNDMSSFNIGKSQEGFRIMYTAGDGKPPRIEVQQWDEKAGWYNIGIYHPKFCPNCGREIKEYGR